MRKDPEGLATKLYGFKHEPKPLVRQPSIKQGLNDTNLMTAPKPDDSLNIDAMTTEVDSLPDFQDQAQLCSMLDDKRSATIRAEELEIALMEMAKEDNRRELTARTTHVATQYGQTAYLYHIVTKWNADADIPDHERISHIHWYLDLFNI